MFAAALCCGVAQAEDPPHRFANSDMLKKPNPEDYYGVWPAEAWQKGLGGTAVINCNVTPLGTLTDCKVSSESPKGGGFGQAAVILASRMQMKPNLFEGKPGGTRIEIPVKFEDPPNPEAPRTGSRVLTREQSALMLNRMVWSVAPDSAAVSAAFPKSASADVNLGHTVLSCRVRPDGTLKECQTASEEPKSQGFGRAGLSLTPGFKLSLEDVDPKLVSRLVINLPIHFLRTGAPPTVITKPDWVYLISPDEAQQLFPAKAADAGLTTGRASLDCVANSHGTMTACQVVSEDPADMDFGSTAVRIAQVMAINPWTPDGLSAEGSHVRFTLRLNQSAKSAAASPPRH